MKEPCFKGEWAFPPVESRGKQPRLEVGAYRTHLPPKGHLKKKKSHVFRDKRKNMGCSEIIVS